MGSQRLWVFLAALAVSGLALVSLRDEATARGPAAPAAEVADVVPGTGAEAGACCLLPSSLIGQDGRIFLEMPGIPGESSHPGAAGQIDVLSWSWGATNAGSHAAGGGGGAGKVNVHDISITKTVDKATPKLMLACATGKHIAEAKLTLRKAGDRPQEYLVITLKNVMVTSYQTGGTGAQTVPTESLSLNFEEIKVDYKEQKADGTSQSHQMTWNIKTNKAQ